MGIFGLFKKQPAFMDDVFGELKQGSSRDPLKAYYTGTISFDGQQTGIILHADESGPSQEQKRFFNELNIAYPGLKREVIPGFLKKELEDWEADFMEDFDEEFNIDCITFERMSSGQKTWELTLFSVTMNHYLTITFQDLMPQEGIIVDG